MLLAGFVLCNSTVADKREEEALDGDVAQVWHVDVQRAQIYAVMKAY